MRSFSVCSVETILTVAVALLYFCNVGLTNGEEISFYGDDGSIFTITLTGGCYTFKPNLDKKATAGEVDRGCFNVWDKPGCLGESRKLTRGAAGLRDFKEIDFDKKISSVSICEERTQESDYHPSKPSNQQSNSYPQHREGPSGGPRTLDNMSLQRVRDVAVSEHNKYRGRHNSPPLQGDPTMNDEAQKYAESLASSNRFELNRNARWIGNIASSVRREPEDAIKDAIGRWYEGVNQYDFNNPGFSRNAGSFTSVVWKASTHMGIGMAWNPHQNNWVVISYYTPSPNLQGAFRENVQPPAR